MGKLFGFIGVGNMGGALAAAAVKGAGAGEVLLSNRTAEKAQALAGRLGCAAGTNEEAAQCRFIFLGVKPQALGALMDELAPVLARRVDRFVLVSMAAGVSIERLRGLCADALAKSHRGRGDAGFAGALMAAAWPVIRIMPNTPAAIGSGMILCSAAPEVAEDELSSFLAGMAPAGRFDLLDETLIDAGSALSGCGPAFAYMFIEALSDGAVMCGLPRKKALDYAAQTLLGSAAMVLEGREHPGALKDAVCSPGGSTIAGVHALEAGGLRAAAIDAVLAAYSRTLELGRGK